MLGETKINVSEFLKNEFILVTGIANSKNLVNYLKSKNANSIIINLKTITITQKIKLISSLNQIKIF